MTLIHSLSVRYSLTTVLLSLAWLPLQAAESTERAPVLEVEVVQSFPHDPRAFTQGLVIDEGQLYEGTGLYGESSVRRVDLESGEVLARENLDRQYFGEGITIMEERLFQLTWRSNIMLVYDKTDFRLLDSFHVPGEGWGLTHDGERLIVSDGTPVLRFLDPENGRETGRVSVTLNGRPLSNINELEYIDGEVWANVWYEDALVRIDPESGEVSSILDLSHLNPFHPAQRDREAVLNGIAVDHRDGRLFVTGKLWPELYEIRVLEEE